MKTVAVIQARMGSSRLPGKVMADLDGRPLIWHVLTRAMAIKGVAVIVLATTQARADDAVAAVARDLGIYAVRGDAIDVLGRYVQAAIATEAELIIRITGDCPLFDPGVAEAMLTKFHLAQGVYGATYGSNVHPTRTYPDGLDVEVFTRSTLDMAAREARSAADREHVTAWMQRKCICVCLALGVDLSAVRWTVDTPEDLEAARLIFGLIERDAHGRPLTTMAATMAAHLALQGAGR